MAFLVGGANTLDTSYSVENSARFDNAGGDALGGTFGTPTNAKTWTLSMWHKKSSGTTSGGQVLFGARSGYENFFLHEETIRIDWNNASGGTINWAPLIRDHSSWYHIVLAHDTSQSTDTNRAKLYINGTQITTLRSGVTANWHNQNLETGYNVDGVAFYVSSYNGSAAVINGYLSEVAFIDGSQLAASSFGETDSNGVWVPKEFKDDVTFGNNGFYLEFKQTGTGTDANGIGADTSGNDNHLAVTNLTSASICTDTPTNNFATLNPLYTGRFDDTGFSYSEGNTRIAWTSNNDDKSLATSTIGVTKGKWYFEAKVIDNSRGIIGVGDMTKIAQFSDAFYDNNPSYGMGVYLPTGNLQENNSQVDDWSSDVSDNDICMLALDMDNHRCWFGINGTWQDSGDPTSGSTGTGDMTTELSDQSHINTGEFIFPFFGDVSVSDQTDMYVNFGNPSFSISSGNADANGYGNFEYAPPSGFYALCSKNLAEYG